MGYFRQFQQKRQTVAVPSGSQVLPIRQFAPVGARGYLPFAGDPQMYLERVGRSGWSFEHVAVTREGLEPTQRYATGGAGTQVSLSQGDDMQQKSVEITQYKENNTGLPDHLKAGVENLSGLSLDDVRVHYHSSKPAEVEALAYTQGSEIHVGPGQEQHLAHEAWHVVQQKQGRVEATAQMRSITINDDLALEREADVMGGKALEWQGGQEASVTEKSGAMGSQPMQLMSLYHGTTIEDANTIVGRGIDPAKGSGEFGMGFYTVFAEAQALHIAMYYWDKEKKYEKGNTGIAVVRVDIPDEMWNGLMQQEKDVVYYDPSQAINETDPEGKKSTELTSWLPIKREKMDKKYFADNKDVKSEDRGKSIIVGPIKDPQTPYLQAVFGINIIKLLNEPVVKKEISRVQKKKGVFGKDQYGKVKEVSEDRRGSLVYTASMSSKDFEENAASKKSLEERQSYVQRLFGGMNDVNIPDEVAKFLSGKGIKGESKGDLIFGYIKYGLPMDVSEMKSEV
jgi:hypothetical protein